MIHHASLIRLPYAAASSSALSTVIVIHHEILDVSMIPGHTIFLLLTVLTALVYAAEAVEENFHERLLLRPNRDGTVTSSFAFTTVLRGGQPRKPESIGAEDECTCWFCCVNRILRTILLAQHYTVFPLSLGQILRDNAITELHLTLNAGKWDYQSWGSPEEEGVGTGAELWAWMADGAPTRCAAQHSLA